MTSRHTLFLSIGATAMLNAAGLLYLRWDYHQVHGLTSALSQIHEINVLAYGAIGDGVTDDGPAFAAAFSDAITSGRPVLIPRKTYVVNNTLAVKSGMIIRSEGAAITHTTNTASILSAIEADDWVIQGPLTLSGTRTAPNQSGSEIGLLIADSKRYIVEKLALENFRGSGIAIMAGTWHTPRGDYGKFSFISFRNNTVGLHIGSGSGAEYNLFTLLSFSGNDTAAVIGAGSNVISTSNIVDNANGVNLIAGPNSGHGILSAVNISHNAGVNVSAVGVPNGFTFDGCHIYGDSELSGIIQLIESRGIHFVGGIIDAAIINDAKSSNYANDNFVTGANYRLCGAGASSFIASNNLLDIEAARGNSVACVKPAKY